MSDNYPENIDLLLVNLTIKRVTVIQCFLKITLDLTKPYFQVWPFPACIAAQNDRKNIHAGETYIKLLQLLHSLRFVEPILLVPYKISIFADLNKPVSHRDITLDHLNLILTWAIIRDI